NILKLDQLQPRALEDSADRERDRDARKSAGDAEHETFRELLAHELSARSAERAPHRRLTAPLDTAEEQHVRNVRARDDEDESDHDAQDAERLHEILARRARQPRTPENG